MRESPALSSTSRPMQALRPQKRTTVCWRLLCVLLFVCVVSDAAQHGTSSQWFTTPAHVPPANTMLPMGASTASAHHALARAQATDTVSNASLLPPTRASIGEGDLAEDTLASVLSIEPSGYIGFGEMRSPLTLVGLFLADISDIYVDDVRVVFNVESQYAVTILALPAHPSPPLSIFCFTDIVENYYSSSGTLANSSAVMNAALYKRCQAYVQPIKITITTAQQQAAVEVGVLTSPMADTPTIFKNWTTVLNGENKVPLLARHSGYTPVLLAITNTVQFMQRQETFLPVRTYTSPAKLWLSTVLAASDNDNHSSKVQKSNYYLSTPRDLVNMAANVTDEKKKPLLFIDKLAMWRLTTRLTVRHSHSVSVGNPLQESESELMRFNARIGYMTFSPVRMFTTMQFVQEELLRQRTLAGASSDASSGGDSVDGSVQPYTRQLPELLWELYNTMHAQVRVTPKEGVSNNASLQWSVGPVVACDSVATVTASVPYPHNRYGLHHVLPSLEGEAQLLSIPTVQYISNRGLRIVNTTTMLNMNTTTWAPFGQSVNANEPPHGLEIDGAHRYHKPGTRSESSDVRRSAFYHRLQIYGAYGRTVPYVPGHDVLPSGAVGDRMEVDIRLHRLRQPPWLKTKRRAARDDAARASGSAGPPLALRLEEETAHGTAPCYLVAADQSSYTCEVGIVPIMLEDEPSPNTAAASDTENTHAEESEDPVESYRALDSCGAGTVAYLFTSNRTRRTTGSRVWELAHPFPVVIYDNSLYMVRSIFQRYPDIVPTLLSPSLFAASPSSEGDGGDDDDGEWAAATPLLRFVFVFTVDNTYNGSYRIHCYGNAGHGVTVGALYERAATDQGEGVTVERVADLCRLVGPEEGTAAHAGEEARSSSSALWLQGVHSALNLTLQGRAQLNITCTFTTAELSNSSLLEGAHCGVSLEALEVEKGSFKPPVRPHNGVVQVNRSTPADLRDTGVSNDTTDSDENHIAELYPALVVELVAPIEPALGGRIFDHHPGSRHRLRVSFSAADDDGVNENDFVVDIPRPRSVEECLHMRRDLYFAPTANATGPRWSFVSGLPAPRMRSTSTTEPAADGDTAYQCTWYVATVLTNVEDTQSVCASVNMRVEAIPTAATAIPADELLLPQVQVVYCGSRSYFLDPITALQMRVPLDTIPQLVDLDQLTEPIMALGEGSTSDNVATAARALVRGGMYQFCVDVRMWSARSPLVSSTATPLGPVLYHLYDVEAASRHANATLNETAGEARSTTYDAAITRIYSVGHPQPYADPTLQITDWSRTLEPQPPLAGLNDSVYFAGGGFVFVDAWENTALFTTAIEVYLLPTHLRVLGQSWLTSTAWPAELAPLQGVVLNDTHILLSILPTVPGGWYELDLASSDTGPLRNATGKPLSLVVQSTATSVTVPDVPGLTGGATIIVRGSNFPVHEVDADLFEVTFGQIAADDDDDDAPEPPHPMCNITSSTTTMVMCTMPSLNKEWVMANAYGTEPRTGYYRLPIIITLRYRDATGARRPLQRITPLPPTDRDAPSSAASSQASSYAGQAGTSGDDMWLYVPIRIAATVIEAITPAVVNAHAPQTAFVVHGEGIIMGSLLFCQNTTSNSTDAQALLCETCLPSGKNADTASLACTVTGPMRSGVYDVRVALEPFTVLPLTIISRSPEMLAASPSTIYPYGEHTITLTGVGFYCANTSELDQAAAVVVLPDLSAYATIGTTVQYCSESTIVVVVNDLGVVRELGGALRVSAGGAVCLEDACVVTVLADDDIPQITTIEPTSGQAPLILTVYGTGFTKLRHSPLRRSATDSVVGSVYLDLGNGHCEPVDALNTVLLCNLSEPCANVDGEQPVQLVSSVYGRTSNLPTTSSLHFRCTMTVDAVSLPTGSLYGGQALTIHGTGFPMDPSLIVVTVAEVVCRVVQLSPTSIDCVTGGALHSVTGVVTVFHNTTKASASCCHYEYSYAISPTITSITPNIAIQGTYVTVRGSGFLGVPSTNTSSEHEVLEDAATDAEPVAVHFGQEVISVVPSSDTTLEFIVKDSYGVDNITVCVPGLGCTLPSGIALTVSMTPAIVQPSSGGFFARSLITLVGTAIDAETRVDVLRERLQVWVCGRLCELTSTSSSGEIQCVVPEYWDVELVETYVSYLTFNHISTGFTEYYLRTSFALSAAAYAAEIAASPATANPWSVATLFKTGNAGASSAVMGTIYYLFEANPHSRLLIYEITFTLRPLSGDPLDLSGGTCELLIPTESAITRPFDVKVFSDPRSTEAWNTTTRHLWAPLAVGENTLSFADSDHFPVSPYFGFYCTGLPANAVIVERAGINGFQVGLHDSGGECPVDMASVPRASSSMPALHSCGSRTGVACATYTYDLAMTPVVTQFSPSYVASASVGGTVTIHGRGFGTSTEEIDQIVLDNVLFEPVSVTDTALVCQLVGDVLNDVATTVVWHNVTSQRGTALVLSAQSFYTPVSWSSLLAWGGATRPEAGDSPTIPAGRSVLLDTSPTPLSTLTVYGTLIVTDRFDIDLTVVNLNILSGGALLAGTAAAPRTRGFTVTLGLIDAEDFTSAYRSEDARQFPQEKLLRVQDGSLQLYGATVNQSIELLDATAEIGASRVTLASRVHWSVGESISVASTSKLAAEEEIRTIVHRSFDGAKTILALDRSLQFRHEVFSSTDILSGYKRNVSTTLAGRVTLLSRAVQIRGGAMSAVSYIGGIARIETTQPLALSGVGLLRMGQLGSVNGFGMWFRNVHFTSSQVVMDHCAVQDGYFRGAVLSNSQHVTIVNTTFHQIEGHGVAAIGAVHRLLTIIDNYVHNTASFRGGVDSVTSGLLLTHPAVTIQGNRLSVSEGHGVWFALRQSYAGSNSRTCPSEAPMGRFIWNSILRVRGHGIFIFPLHFATATTCASNLFAVSADSSGTLSDEDVVFSPAIDGSSVATQDAGAITTGMVTGVANGTLVWAGVLESNIVITCGLHGVYLPPSSSYRLTDMVLSDCAGAAAFVDFSTNITSIASSVLSDATPYGVRSGLSERRQPLIDPLNTNWAHLALIPPGSEEPTTVFESPSAVHMRHGGFLTLMNTMLGGYAKARQVVLLALPRASHKIYVNTTMAYYTVVQSSGITFVQRTPQPSKYVMIGGQVSLTDHDGSLLALTYFGYTTLLSGASYLQSARNGCKAATVNALLVVSVNTMRSPTLTSCRLPDKRIAVFALTADTLRYDCDAHVPGCHKVTANVTSSIGSFTVPMEYPSDGFVADSSSVLPSFFHFVNDFDLAIALPSPDSLANGATVPSLNYYDGNITYTFARVNMTEDGTLVTYATYPTQFRVTYFTFDAYFPVSASIFVEVASNAFYLEANNLFATTMVAIHEAADAPGLDTDDSSDQDMARSTLLAPPRVQRFVALRELNVTRASHEDVTNKSWSTVNVVSCPEHVRCMTPSYAYLHSLGSAAASDFAVTLAVTTEESRLVEYDFFDIDAWLYRRPPWLLYARDAGDARTFSIPAGYRVRLSGRNATIDGALIVMGELIIDSTGASGTQVLRCESIAVFGRLHITARHSNSPRIDVRLGYMAPFGSTYEAIEAEMATGMRGFEADPWQYTCYNRSQPVKLTNSFELFCGTLYVAGEALLEGWTDAPTTWRAREVISAATSHRVLPGLQSLANTTNADVYTTASLDELKRRLPRWFFYPYGTNTTFADLNLTADAAGESAGQFKGTALWRDQWLSVVSSSQSLDEEEVVQLSADLMYTQRFEAITGYNRVTHRVRGVADSSLIKTDWRHTHGLQNITDGEDDALRKGNSSALPHMQASDDDDDTIHTDEGRVHSEVVLLSKKVELNCLIPEAASQLGCQVMVRAQAEPHGMFSKPNFTCLGTMIRHFGKTGSQPVAAEAKRQRFFMPAVYINATGEGGATLSGSVLFESFATAVYGSPTATGLWLVDSAVVGSYGGGVRLDTSQGLFVCGVVVTGTRYARNNMSLRSTVPRITTTGTPFTTMFSLQRSDLMHVQSLCSFLVNNSGAASGVHILNTVAAGSESEGFCLQWDMDSARLVAHSNTIGLFLFSGVRYRSPKELAELKELSGGNATAATPGYGTSDCGDFTICTQSFVSSWVTKLSATSLTVPPTAARMASLFVYMNRFIGVYSSSVAAIEFTRAHLIANPIGMAVSVSPLFENGAIVVTDSFISSGSVCGSARLMCAPSPFFDTASRSCGPVAFVDTTYQYASILLTPSYQQLGLDYDRSAPVTAITAGPYEMDVSSFLHVTRTKFGGVGVYECPEKRSSLGEVVSVAHTHRGAAIMGNAGTVSSSSLYMVGTSDVLFSEVVGSVTTLNKVVPSAVVVSPSTAKGAPTAQYGGPVTSLSDVLVCGGVACYPFRETTIRDDDGTLLGASGKFTMADGSLDNLCTVHVLSPSLVRCPAVELQQLTIRGLDDRTKLLTDVNLSFTLQVTTATSGGESTVAVSESVVAVVTTQSPDAWYAWPHNISAPCNSEMKKTAPFTSVRLHIPNERYPDVLQVSTSACNMVTNNEVVRVSFAILDVAKTISVWDANSGQKAAFSTTLSTSTTISEAQVSAGVTAWHVDSVFDSQTGAESKTLYLSMTCGKTLKVHQQVFGEMTLYTAQTPSTAEQNSRYMESHVPANLSAAFPGPLTCLSGNLGLRVVRVYPNPNSINDAFLTARIEWADSLHYNVTEATEQINNFLNLFTLSNAGLSTTTMTGALSDGLFHEAPQNTSEKAARATATAPGASGNVNDCLQHAVLKTHQGGIQGFHANGNDYFVVDRTFAYTPMQFVLSRELEVDGSAFSTWKPYRLAVYVTVVVCLILLGFAVLLARDALKKGFVAHFAASEADSTVAGSGTGDWSAPLWRRSLDALRPKAIRGFSFLARRGSSTSSAPFAETEMTTKASSSTTGAAASYSDLVLSELAADPHAATIAAAARALDDDGGVSEEGDVDVPVADPLIALEHTGGTPPQSSGAAFTSESVTHPRRGGHVGPARSSSVSASSTVYPSGRRSSGEGGTDSADSAAAPQRLPDTWYVSQERTNPDSGEQARRDYYVQLWRAAPAVTDELERQARTRPMPEWNTLRMTRGPISATGASTVDVPRFLNRPASRTQLPHFFGVPSSGNRDGLHSAVPTRHAMGRAVTRTEALFAPPFAPRQSGDGNESEYVSVGIPRPSEVRPDATADAEDGRSRTPLGVRPDGGELWPAQGRVSEDHDDTLGSTQKNSGASAQLSEAPAIMRIQPILLSRPAGAVGAAMPLRGTQGPAANMPVVPVYTSPQGDVALPGSPLTGYTVNSTSPPPAISLPSSASRRAAAPLSPPLMTHTGWSGGDSTDENVVTVRGRGMVSFTTTSDQVSAAEPGVRPRSAPYWSKY